jgi:hypothetical protein
VTQDSILFLFGGTVLSSLVGCVVYLFRSFEAEKVQTRLDLEECRRDREALWKRISELQCSIEGK